MTIRLISGEDLEISTASLIENSLKTRDQTSQLKPVVSLPASPLRIPKSRSPVQRGSRLRNMVSRSDEDDEAPKQSVLITERMLNVKMATRTRGSYVSKPGGRAAIFRMLKTGQSTPKIYS